MIDVVCALIVQGSSVWAACRAEGVHAGKWEFPGGKVETDQGESPESAILREIREELACDVVITGAGTPVVHDYGAGKCVRLIPFYCTSENQPVALEHQELRLVNKKEANLLDWLPPDIPILEEWLRTQDSMA